jgi:outer membrane protein OmpA-like peptidoglycan-associated protein
VVSAASGDGKFQTLTAFLDRPQGEVGVSLIVIDRDAGAGLAAPVVVLRVVESKPMTSGQVVVDAKAMSDGLIKNGHIALYGIHFSTDSAKIEASSDDTLGQMVKMLQQEPTAKVYIVGHTDNTGELAHNLTLSKERAEAVVRVLVTKYGISPGRLAAEGVASFSPVASNASDAGRARNRRVEMVLQ